MIVNAKPGTRVFVLGGAHRGARGTVVRRRDDWGGRPYVIALDGVEVQSLYFPSELRRLGRHEQPERIYQ